MRTENLISNFELMILLTLIRLGDNAYGVPISREIERQTRRRVAVASIYAALERLQDKGYVKSQLGEPTPERGGRAKRYFKVTGSGIREARGVRETLTRMWEGLAELEGGQA